MTFVALALARGGVDRGRLHYRLLLVLSRGEKFKNHGLVQEHVSRAYTLERPSNCHALF